jgi:hypothetical protein
MILSAGELSRMDTVEYPYNNIFNKEDRFWIQQNNREVLKMSWVVSGRKWHGVDISFSRLLMKIPIAKMLSTISCLLFRI